MKERVKNRLFWISDYFDNNPLNKAVRQGMVMMIPVLLGSAVALMLSSLPFAGYQSSLKDFGMEGYQCSWGLSGVHQRVLLL